MKTFPAQAYQPTAVMSSLFAAIGSRLRPDGLQPGKRGRGPRRQQPFLCQKILRVIGGVSSVTAEADALKTRRVYRKQFLHELAEEALTSKKDNEDTRYWRQAFLREKYGDMTTTNLKSKLGELRAALRPDRRKEDPLFAHVPNPSGPRCERVAAFRKGASRSALPRNAICRYNIEGWRCAAEIEEALWCWFVDRLRTNKTRVCTLEIIHVANQYSNAIINDWRKDCESGLESIDKPPRLPTINRNFIARWRKRYGVSYRSVNLRYQIPRKTYLRYKIPRKTFLSRLQVFWSNCIILRKLFELMCPGQVLHWVGFDQKPLWFNAICGERGYGFKGQDKTSVAENVSASRVRFTAMTRVQDWITDEPPSIAVLFRSGAAACSLDNLRKSLTKDDNTLVQGAEKGSYRLEQVLEFLAWSLKPASELGFPLCVVLDWFAPHLHEDVDALCHKLGHCVLRIGGGLTPWVQVGDTYKQHYRDLEKAAATAAWDRRPGSLLEWRQSVLTRSVDAWNLVDHSKCAGGWKHNGITNPLDGTDDQLGSQVLPLWHELNMDAIRCQLIEDVEDAVFSGEITSFWQYPELLLQYDNHPPLVDCMEPVPTYVYDESHAHADVCSAELFGDDIADDKLEDTIDQEQNEFEESVVVVPAASGSAACPSTPRLAASAGALQADCGEAMISDTCVTSSAAPFLGALQPAPDEVKADALPVGATSSLDEKGDMPPGVADDDAIHRAKVVDAFTHSAALFRDLGEEQLALYRQAQATRTIRAARTARSKLSKGVNMQRKRKIAECRAEGMANRVMFENKKVELKIATEQRLAATAAAKQESALAKSKDIESKAARLTAAKANQAAAKEKEIEAKKAKENIKLQRQEALKNMDHLRRTFAGCYAKSLVDFLQIKIMARIDKFRFLGPLQLWERGLGQRCSSRQNFGTRETKAVCGAFLVKTCLVN